MPRRKNQPKKKLVEEEEYCPGCLEYGMDDYDDPTDHMTPEEIQELAKYITEMNGGMLYPPDDFIDDEAEEGEEEEDEEDEEEDEDEDEDNE